LTGRQAPASVSVHDKRLCDQEDGGHVPLHEDRRTRASKGVGLSGALMIYVNQV
jgi:hypothetical protein